MSKTTFPENSSIGIEVDPERVRTAYGRIENWAVWTRKSFGSN